MRNWPANLMHQHSIFIAALCDDWMEAGTVTRDTPRADRVCEINRQVNEQIHGGAGVPNKQPASDTHA